MILDILSKLIKSPVSFSDSPDEKGIQRTFAYFSSLFWLFTTIVAVWCFAGGLTQAENNGYSSGISTFFAAISTCSALAAASSVLGGLFGFLFGIPKSNQNQENPNAENRKWRSGTNLEEISDWLTKILVGVGLAEATQLGGVFSDVLKFMTNEKVFPKDAGGGIIVPTEGGTEGRYKRDPDYLMPREKLSSDGFSSENVAITVQSPFGCWNLSTL